MEKTNTEKKKPTHTAKKGRFSLSFWENTNKDGKKYKTAKISIGYKKKEDEEWKHKELNINSKEEYDTIVELLTTNQTQI